MRRLDEELETEWKEETGTFERVKEVSATTTTGETALEISNQALVSETTARKHLETLAADGYVAKDGDGPSGATRYKRSWTSLTFEQARQILRVVDSDELLEEVRAMQNEIREYQCETGLDSPGDIAWDDADIDQETLRRWRTTERNLSFAKVALALDQAEDTVRTPREA